MTTIFPIVYVLNYFLYRVINGLRVWGFLIVRNVITYDYVAVVRLQQRQKLERQNVSEAAAYQGRPTAEMRRHVSLSLASCFRFSARHTH